jgi:hypothetical protein
MVGFNPSVVQKCNKALMAWKPATVEEVQKIVQNDLTHCSDEQIALFEKCKIAPTTFPIVRYGRLETVVVIAQKGQEVMYWEDVEEGFNISPLSSDRQIREHWCNQDELGFALNRWLNGGRSSCGPATRHNGNP